MRTLSIPPTDAEEFARLPDCVRNEVREWMSVLATVRNSSPLKASAAAAAKRMGRSYPTVIRKLYAYEADGWRALVNRAKCPVESQGLPADFVTYWQMLCELNQRKSAPAYRQLLKQWRNGDKIPGYSAWPQPDPATSIPRGWSYDNLIRKQSDDFSKTAMRQGKGAALSMYGPKIITTRVGLWVGSHFVIDDLKRDIQIAFLGGRGQRATIQELGVLDLFSAHRFAVHRRPQYEREDGTKDSLKEKEMRYLVAAILRTYGVSSRGTEMVVEKGTAAIRKPLAAWLHEQSNELITVRLPGDLGKEQVLPGYRGSGGGNPRHKAHLESIHNLIHNESAHLPAPTGHDRNPPEWLYEVEQESEQVLEWMRTLPAERAMLLRLGMLEYWQALSLLSDLDHQIASRTDHEIQGWAECGHTVIEFREHPDSQEWISQSQMLALPSGMQDAIALAANSLPHCMRARKLSPLEVWSRGAQTLQPFPDHIIALMFCDRSLGDDLRREKRLTRSGVFEIQDTTVEPEAMEFEGRMVMRPDGGTFALDEKQSYNVVLNPFDRSALWVFSMRGEYQGTAPRRYRVSQLDTEGMQKALGQRSHIVAELTAPIRDRHAEAARLVTEMREHNQRVISGAPVTPTERQQVKQQAREETDASERRKRRMAAEAAQAQQFLNSENDF